MSWSKTQGLEDTWRSGGCYIRKHWVAGQCCQKATGDAKWKLSLGQLAAATPGEPLFWQGHRWPVVWRTELGSSCGSMSRAYSNPAPSHHQSPSGASSPRALIPTWDAPDPHRVGVYRITTVFIWVEKADIKSVRLVQNQFPYFTVPIDEL